MSHTNNVLQLSETRWHYHGNISLLLYKPTIETFSSSSSYDSARSITFYGIAQQGGK